MAEILRRRSLLGNGGIFPSFTYTGDWKWFKDNPSLGILEIYSSGTFTCSNKSYFDICLIGAGGSGASWHDSKYGTGGGAGGYMENYYNINMVSANISVALSNSSSTTLLHDGITHTASSGASASGGAGGSGGTGGGGGSADFSGNGGSNGSDGVSVGGSTGNGTGDKLDKHMFGIDDPDYLFCGGGGGGGGRNAGYGGSGGAGGGGAGSSGTPANGNPGTKYGAGGGGASTTTHYSTTPVGGKGYQGAVFIRKSSPRKSFDVPQGLIVWYSGDTIPDGWYICDGTNGTPDLRERFIVGAGSNYNLGDIGGEKSVTLTTNQIPSHTHSINTFSGYTNDDSTTYTVTFAYSSGSTKTNTGSSGGGVAHNNMPSYYVLYAIMKG